VTLVGEGGGLVRTTEFVLEVVEPRGFSILVTPNLRQVRQGESVSFTVQVTGTGGFSDPVLLMIAGLPEGCSPSATMNDVPPDFETTLTIHTSTDTPLGTYSLHLIGRGGGLTRESNVFTLEVIAPAQSPTTTQPPQTSPTPSTSEVPTVPPTTLPTQTTTQPAPTTTQVTAPRWTFISIGVVIGLGLSLVALLIRRRS